MMVKPRENRVPIMMSDEELKAIDDWRFENHIATRSDAIRRLCRSAFVAMDSFPSAREGAETALTQAYDLHDEILNALESENVEQEALDVLLARSLEMMKSTEELRLTLSSTFLQILELTAAKTLKEMSEALALVQAETEKHLEEIKQRHREWSQK